MKNKVADAKLRLSSFSGFLFCYIAFHLCYKGTGEEGGKGDNSSLSRVASVVHLVGEGE